MTETIDIPALPYNNKNKNDTPFINNVKVKYLTSKTDKFNKEISYFKITSEIKQILGYLNSGFKCPFWVSDDGIVLKVNKKMSLNLLIQRVNFTKLLLKCVFTNSNLKTKN